MVKACCIKYCRSECFRGCGISFHSFPKDESMLQKWLDIIPMTGSSKFKKVCSKHFKTRDFIIEGSRKRLTANAVPSLLLSPSKLAGKLLKCKCCLTSNELQSMWQVHVDGDKRENYGTLLIECFALPWHEPKKPNGSLDMICRSCIARLKEAVSFKTQVLASQVPLIDRRVEDLDELKDVKDDEDVQFDVKTEYLDYEYLEVRFDKDDDCEDEDYEDSNDDVRNDGNDSARDDGGDVQDDVDRDDDMEPADSKDEDTAEWKANKTARSHRKRMRPAELVLDPMASEETCDTIPVKRLKDSNKPVVTNTKILGKAYKTKRKTMIRESKGYLEDILRYSNATPIGRHTSDGFECSFCEHTFNMPMDLKHHTLDKHASDLTVHPKTNHIKLDITNLKCLDCYAKIDSLQDLLNHRKTEHKMMTRRGMHVPIVPFRFDSDIMKCAMCQKKFKTFYSLDKHMKVHFKNYKTGYESMKLDETSENSGESSDIYEVHEDSLDGTEVLVSKKHSKFTSDESDTGEMSCLVCDCSFGNQTALLVHMNKFHLKLLVKCNFCDAKFLDAKVLARHVTVKHSSKSPKVQIY